MSNFLKGLFGFSLSMFSMQLQHKDHGNKLQQQQLQPIDQEEIIHKHNNHYQRYLLMPVDKNQQFDKIYDFHFQSVCWTERL